MKDMVYGAYGSNLNLKQMSERCPFAILLGAAELENYKLTFKAHRRMPVADIEYCKGSKVPILLWELDEAAEKQMDKYEGFPTCYTKKYEYVEFEGKKIKILLYIINPKNDCSFGSPSDIYYNKIRKGYEEAGFDVNVLNTAVKEAISRAKKQQKKNF